VYRFSTTSALLDARVTPSDPSSTSHFGTSVSLSDNFLAVGAPGEDRSGLTNTGAVYIFRRELSGWVEEAKLIAPQPISGQRFGHAVALASNHLFISAPDEDGQQGVVYRFSRSSGAWQFEQEFSPSGPAIEGQRFGYSLATDGSWCAVGMLQNAPEGAAPGRVEMLLNMGSSWTSAQVVAPALGSLDNRFGVSVSVKGSLLAVGALGLSDISPNSGGAYLYTLAGGTWNESQLLRPMTEQANQFAGHSVSLNPTQTLSTEVLVGAPLNDSSASDSGAVYVYRRIGSTFSPMTTLRGVNEQAGDQFGFSTALGRFKGLSRFVVGAPLDDSIGPNAGVGYASRGVVVAVRQAFAACNPPWC
jgi:hypothetical protein